MAARKNTSRLPSSFTSRARNVRRDYLEGVLSGKIPTPAPGTPEAKSLARAASFARWGKAPKAMSKLGRNSGTTTKQDPTTQYEIDTRPAWFWQDWQLKG